MMIKNDEPRKNSTSSGSTTVKSEELDSRSRKHERRNSDTVKADDTPSDDEQKSGSGNDDKDDRKRKRSRKGLDKKYSCPHEGCGKSYSRAEHLYRHQLNHKPKQIYTCDYPDCGRWFVRQDLCTRHRERHTTRGSHLQRKDNYFVNPDVAAALPHGHLPPAAHGHRLPPNDLSVNTGPFHQPPYHEYHHAGVLHSPAADHNGLTGNPRAAEPMNAPDVFRSLSSFQLSPTTTSSGHSSGLHRSNSDGQYYSGDTNVRLPETSHPGREHLPVHESQRHASFGSSDHARYPKPPPKRSSASQYPGPSADEALHWTASRPQQQAQTQIPSYNSFAPQQTFPPISTLPPPNIPLSQTSPFQPQPWIDPNVDLRNRSNGMPGILGPDTMLTDPGLGIFDGDGVTRSPIVMANDFAAWLFNESQPVNGSGPHHHHQHHDPHGLDSSLRMSFSNPMQQIPTQTSMAVTSLLEPSRPTILSDTKRRQIIALIESRFHETDHSPVGRKKEHLLAGNRDLDGHVLSLRSFQTYIGSYWYHFHDQMPILHRPTFSADKAQPLLLIAVLAIGAANVDKGYGQQFTNFSAELANFLAWHLRNELFMDKDFPPPTRLWVLQSLILVECYEKMYSSRALHERSQIHHATTISLLRRGSALLGRSGMDSPPSNEEEKPSIADTPDAWWNHWITTEATKRIAYAAFIIDSVHSTMFSHTAVMLAHEMRLPLPCDESLWTATSGMEVGRIENSLRAKDMKEMRFLDALKATLNGKPVRTDRFGRTALMAGLLNVCFHLSQRDQQVRSLGIGGMELWRGYLTKAFDIWERDWSNEPPTAPSPSSSNNTRTSRDESISSYASSSTVDEEQLFESRVVLHHLAHMGMHVDVVQCQIYAKAKRLLGRRITPKDYDNTVNRMRKFWAPSARARDAVFYSLKFVGQVLTPDIIPGPTVLKTPASQRTAGSQGEYNPRDDYLLNRPWVLYFAALVIWSYGYALDGPLPPSRVPRLETKEDQVKDMRAFMQRVAAVGKPDDLQEVRERNACVGLLMFLRGKFEGCRWELMHEASRLLGNCVDMLVGASGSCAAADVGAAGVGAGVVGGR